jgi:hypothetical protein
VRSSIQAAFVILCLAAAPAGAAPAGEAKAGEKTYARIVVEAGTQARIDTPVSASLEGVAVPLEGGWRLEEVRGDERQTVPCQISGSESPRLWWILTGTTAAGASRTFEITADSGSAEVAGSAVRVARDDGTVRILQGGGEVLAYNHVPVPPPEGADWLYTRSAFIHPLRSPSGAVLTRIHPPDHIHHMGLWNPYTRTRFEGRDVDFWNLKKGQGTVRFARFAALTEGPVFGGFRAMHDHVDLKAPGGEKAALNEEWIVRVWNVGGAGEGRRLLDITSVLTCATTSPVTLLAYRYGGLGFRAVESWNEGNYLTSEGKQREDGHSTRARWCQVFGPTDKGPAGILFMSHPQNRAHPEPMRIWNNQPEIFFNFCPVQKADWELVPGRTYVLRYRLYVYDGELSPEDSERIWGDFGRPPRVTVETSP